MFEYLRDLALVITVVPSLAMLVAICGAAMLGTKGAGS